MRFIGFGPVTGHNRRETQHRVLFDREMAVRFGVLVWMLLVARALADAAGPEYVGSEDCMSCHESAASAWRDSHHALAWTWPSAETVVADFAGTEFVPMHVFRRCVITDHVSGQRQRQNIFLPRSVSLHGFCSTHIPGESPGYRSLPAITEAETLSPGYPRQSKPINNGRCERAEGLADISSSRSNHRPDLRSDNHSCGGALSQGLSRQTSPRQVSRYRIGQNLRISHKQFLPAADHNCSFISQSLAGGVVLQMDKTKSPHQRVLWHIRECGEVADLDSRFGIYLGSNHEKNSSGYQRISTQSYKF